MAGWLIDRISTDDKFKHLNNGISIFEHFPKEVKITEYVLKGCCHKIVLHKNRINVSLGNHRIVGGKNKHIRYSDRIKVCHFKWRSGVIEKMKYRIETFDSKEKGSKKYIEECKRLISFYEGGEQ